MRARKVKPGIRPIGGEDPKKKAKGTSGSTAVIKRNKKGELKSTLPEDFGGVSQKTLAEDRAVAAGTGNGMFAVKPRTGGATVRPADGPVGGGSKKQLRMARRRVRRNSASKAAKRSAIRLY